jgi:hypothetical protein
LINTKIPNPLHKDDLHTTLMYSENKNIDGYKNAIVNVVVQKFPELIHLMAEMRWY